MAKQAKIIYLNQQNDAVIYNIKQGAGKKYLLDGVLILKDRIAKVEVAPLSFDVNSWKKSSSWRDIGQKGNVSRHTFKDKNGKIYKVVIIASKDKKTHRIEITHPSGKKTVIITSDNIAPIVYMGIAALVCLGIVAITLLLIDCKEQCGEDKVDRIKVSGWKCTVECICKK